jgi:hypothetical protein
MPPWYDKLMHSNARLSKPDRDALANGLARNVREEPTQRWRPKGGGGSRSES